MKLLLRRSVHGSPILLDHFAHSASSLRSLWPELKDAMDAKHRNERQAILAVFTVGGVGVVTNNISTTLRLLVR